MSVAEALAIVRGNIVTAFQSIDKVNKSINQLLIYLFSLIENVLIV